MKVFIDSSCDIQYSSFYIYGLYRVYGRKNVKFSSKYFKDFKHNNHFFAFIIKENKNKRKIIIDFTDSKSIDENALHWSDVYGKINLDANMSSHPKIISIGPSFGIRIYSLIETIWFAFSNFFKSYYNIHDIRKFFSDYKAQYRRPKFSDYHSKQSKGSSVFFISSLWKQESLTNTYRANFIKSCRANPNVVFEGGFVPRTNNDIRGYETLTTVGRVDMNVYLDKIKQSVLVFNTPAVKDCHGWKLAEFLCLGKAIISTPLTRILPDALKDRDQLLYTNGDIDDITDQVNELVLNPNLRQQLEANSQTYFEFYLAPQQIIERLTNS